MTGRDDPPDPDGADGGADGGPADETPGRDPLHVRQARLFNDTPEKQRRFALIFGGLAVVAILALLTVAAAVLN